MVMTTVYVVQIVGDVKDLLISYDLLTRLNFIIIVTLAVSIPSIVYRCTL